MVGRLWWFALVGAARAIDWNRTGNWSTLSCEDPAVVNAANLAPEVRWGLLDCDHAWSDVLEAWKSPYYQDNHVRFSEAMFDQFHDAPGVQCGNLHSVGSCRTPVRCNTHHTSGPAVTVILNSLVAVHLMFAHWYDALRDIADTSTDIFGIDFGILSNTSSKEEIARITPILIDMIPAAAIVAAVPSFNISVDETAYFPVNSTNRRIIVDTAISTVAPVVKERIKIAQENATAEPWGLFTVSELTYGLPYLIWAVYAWEGLAADAASRLFSGSDESIQQLTSLIEDGRMLSINRSATQFDHLVTESPSSSKARRGAIVRAAYAFGLPASWVPEGARIFVFDSGLGCDDPLDKVVPNLMSAETAEATSSCHGGKLYFLVAANKKGTIFSVPPSLDKLDPEKYGNLSRSDIILGSVRTYESNGNKNGAVAFDPTDSTVLEGLYDQGITTPGYIRLAVCNADEAIRNRGSDVYDTYPCDRVGSAAGARATGGVARGLWWGVLLAVSWLML